MKSAGDVPVRELALLSHVHEDTEEWRELKDKDRDDTEEWKELRAR